MKKSMTKPEGYFSFNTPTGDLEGKNEKNDASVQPAFNDFVCMPESEQAKKVDGKAQQSDLNYF